jgi:hypothetical protein
MITTAPAVVTRYLAAADLADFVALAECFTLDGRVLDEGNSYRGRAAIIGWRQALAGQWSYTSTVTGSEGQGKEHLVRVRVEGNFPGGVADLTFRFSLRDALISELVIE